MIYRVSVITNHHTFNRPEIDIFYFSTNLSLCGFVRFLIVDETFDINKWFNQHRDDFEESMTPEELFEKALTDIQLDQTSNDFGCCCEECHAWLVISEYKPQSERCWQVKNPIEQNTIINE